MRARRLIVVGFVLGLVVVAIDDKTFDVTGDLTLHGVTRPITIPTEVTLSGNDMRARGEFSIERDDFGIKATSAFHGMVRVRNNIKFTFDIVGHQR